MLRVRRQGLSEIWDWTISIAPPPSSLPSILPYLAADLLNASDFSDMDNNRTAIHELFSRGNTPPAQQNLHQQYTPPPQLSNNSSPNQIDALFQNITGPVAQPSSQQSQQQQQPQQQQPQQQQHFSPQLPVHPSSQGADNTHTVVSAPVTPVMALNDGPSPAASVTASDRQSALLSLLAGPAMTNRPPAQASTSSLPTQVPTPPGSSQRSNASPGHNESQGKFLLEQLMAGYVLFPYHVFLPLSCTSVACYPLCLVVSMLPFPIPFSYIG